MGASVLADDVSHVVAHGRRSYGAEITHGLWASSQILEAFLLCRRAWASCRSRWAAQPQ